MHVPAGETSEGRARLYARNAARTHALDQLRIGAIRRIASALRLPRTAQVDAVSVAARAATGRDAASVARLLADDAPTGDRDLVDSPRSSTSSSTTWPPPCDTHPDDAHRPAGRRP